MHWLCAHVALLIRSGQWVIKWWFQRHQQQQGRLAGVQSLSLPLSVQSGPGSQVQPQAVYAELLWGYAHDFIHLMDIFSFSNHICSSGPHYGCLYLNCCSGSGTGDFCKEEINTTGEFLPWAKESISEQGQPTSANVDQGVNSDFSGTGFEKSA